MAFSRCRVWRMMCRCPMLWVIRLVGLVILDFLVLIRRLIRRAVRGRLIRTFGLLVFGWGLSERERILLGYIRIARARLIRWFGIC